jgi:radical SAM superfamily enzyme YgiQ (UPF0313 family)
MIDVRRLIEDLNCELDICMQNAYRCSEMDDLVQYEIHNEAYWYKHALLQSLYPLEDMLTKTGYYTTQTPQHIEFVALEEI